MDSKVMTEPIDVHIIWYGLAWTSAQNPKLPPKQQNEDHQFQRKIQDKS
jgi:hypothetical protein